MGGRRLGLGLRLGMGSGFLRLMGSLVAKDGLIESMARFWGRVGYGIILGLGWVWNGSVTHCAVADSLVSIFLNLNYTERRVSHTHLNIPKMRASQTSRTFRPDQTLIHWAKR